MNNWWAHNRQVVNKQWSNSKRIITNIAECWLIQYTNDTVRVDNSHERNYLVIRKQCVRWGTCGVLPKNHSWIIYLSVLEQHPMIRYSKYKGMRLRWKNPRDSEVERIYNCDGCPKGTAQVRGGYSNDLVRGAWSCIRLLAIDPFGRLCRTVSPREVSPEWSLVWQTSASSSGQLHSSCSHWILWLWMCRWCHHPLWLLS